MTLQDLWINGLEWDEEISGQNHIQMKTWFQEQEDLPQIEIQRCLQDTKPVTEKKIHVFTDASSQACGAVGY